MLRRFPFANPTLRRYSERRIEAALATRAEETPDPGFDRADYRERNGSEQLVNRLEPWRRIATRYEKRAANYLVMLTLAAILFWP